MQQTCSCKLPIGISRLSSGLIYASLGLIDRSDKTRGVPPALCVLNYSVHHLPLQFKFHVMHDMLRASCKQGQSHDQDLVLR